MIRYTLVCDKNHRFDSWFQSSSAFDTLAKAGQLTCASCESTNISRAMMAPAVPAKSNTADLKAPASDAESAVKKLREDVEANSEYVGQNFATEARQMHESGTTDRAIYGEAKLDDAKKLIEDGIPVAPLPFMPKRKVS